MVPGPICKWCNGRLTRDDRDYAENDPIHKKTFCSNNYCEVRYIEENNKISILTNRNCSFCYKTPPTLNWRIGKDSFCNGKCVDFFNDKKINPELREIKMKEEQLMEDLQVVRNSLKEMLDKICNNRYNKIHYSDDIKARLKM